MKYNKSLVLFMIFTVIACISIVGSASAASTGNNSTNITHTVLKMAVTADTENTAIEMNQTGQSKYKGPQTNTTKYNNGSSSSNGLSVTAKNGTTYSIDNGDLHAVSSNGTALWTYYIDHSGGGEGGFFQNAPTLGSDGTIYMLGMGNLYAINSNGTEKWIYHTGATAYDYSSPVIGANGIIYFANGWSVYGIDTKLSNPDEDDPLYKFDSNGQITDGLKPSSDGKTFYFATNSNSVYAIDSTTLTKKWQYDGIKVNGFGFILGSDGTLYLPSFTSPYGIYALNPDGIKKWNYTTLSLFSGLSMASDGTIYFGNVVTGGKYQFTALSSDGAFKWNSTVIKRITSTAVIGSDGTIYVGASNGILYAFNPDGTLKWSYDITSVLTGQTYQFYNSKIDPDGTLSFLVGANNYGTNSYVSFGLQDLVGNFTSTPGSNLDVQFNDTSSNIPTSWSWSFGDGSTSTAQNPKHTYATGGTYTITLTVTTAFGDTNTITRTITVKDVTVPTVTGKPVYNIPKQTITVNLSEPVKAGNYWIELKDNNGKAVAFTKSIDGNILTLTLNNKLNTSTYTLIIHTSSLTDLAGNNVSLYTYTFTVDATAPTVKTIDPTNKATNITTNKVIKVTFSEPVQAGNYWIELKDNNGKAVNFTKSINGNILTITPSALVKGTKYTVILHTGSITDLSGNNISLYTSSFTTDETAPTIKTIDPTNKATNITTNKVIKVTFNESIKAGNYWIELKDNNGKAVNFTKSINGNTLTITPSALVKGTKYTVILHTGSITDLSGNNVALVTSSFTTDGTAPTIKTIDPTNKATNIAIDKIIKITFNESIKAGNYWIELKDNNGKAVSFTKSISGNIFTITPTSALVKGTKYTVILHTGSITDLAGNNVALYTSSFTTDGTAPTIKTIDPVNNAVNVATNKTIKVTFSEAVQLGSGTLKLVGSNGKTVSVTTSVNGNVLTIKPTSNLTKGVKYTLTLSTGSLTDLAGNSLKAYSTAFTVVK